MESLRQSRMLPKPNQGLRVDPQVKRKDHLPKRRHPVVVRELQEKEEFLLKKVLGICKKESNKTRFRLFHVITSSLNIL